MWKSKKQSDTEGLADELFHLEEELVSHMPIEKKKQAKVLVVLDLLVNLAIIVILVYLVRQYLVAPFRVYGPSMCDTLNYYSGACHHNSGEYIIVNKAVYQSFGGLFEGKPKRGDIIVFRPPENPADYYIKRIIGLPGEKIELRDGKVFLFNQEFPGGKELPEPYLNAKNKGNTQSFAGKRIFDVPADVYFALGDNRRESTDSRTCFIPAFSKDCSGDNYFLPRKFIEGKAWFVLLPPKNIRLLQGSDSQALAVK